MVVELSYFKVDLGVSFKRTAYVYHEDKHGAMWIEIWAYDEMDRQVYHKTHKVDNGAPRK